MEACENERVLVTGASGTVGSELIRQLLSAEAGPKEVIGLDNNEHSLFHLEQTYRHTTRAKLYHADIRDLESVSPYFEDIDTVFHAAALKHVTICERSPEQAIYTNITGVQNVISASRKCGVRTTIFTSSDKAVNPTNVMGTTKLMGERLITSANGRNRSSGQVFASTRFGNILGSSGSVIPVFRQQIASDGPLTLTDENMTRFIMSVEQAVGLVLESKKIARGGEVFVTKMPALRILDLAEAMIDELSLPSSGKNNRIEITRIGAKPGEKLYEELLSDEETRRTVELPKYYVIRPAFKSIADEICYEYPDAISTSVDLPYTSKGQELLTIDQIKAFLKLNGLLHSPC